MTVRGIFVTGTDTHVGKTIAAAVISRLLKLQGVDVGVMKPVTSGCEYLDGERISADAELLRWAVGASDRNPAVTPYILQAPLAPSVAADQEGIRIRFPRIMEAFEELTERHEFIIVEGAGGLMVPLAGGLLIADLIRELALPLLVVTRPNLGTVNHTLLTTYSAARLGLETRGIIINNYPESPDEAEACAPHLLSSLSGAPVLGIFPRIEHHDPREIVVAIVAALLEQPTTSILLREVLRA